MFLVQVNGWREHDEDDQHCLEAPGIYQVRTVVLFARQNPVGEDAQRLASYHREGHKEGVPYIPGHFRLIFKLKLHLEKTRFCVFYCLCRFNKYQEIIGRQRETAAP